MSTARDEVLRNAEAALANTRSFQAKAVEANRVMEAKLAQQIAELERLVADLKAKGPS